MSNTNRTVPVRTFVNPRLHQSASRAKLWFAITGSAIVLLDVSFVSPRGFSEYHRLQPEWLVPAAPAVGDATAPAGYSGVFHDDAYNVPTSIESRHAIQQALAKCNLTFSSNPSSTSALVAVARSGTSCSLFMRRRSGFTLQCGAQPNGRFHRLPTQPWSHGTNSLLLQSPMSQRHANQAH